MGPGESLSRELACCSCVEVVFTVEVPLYSIFFVCFKHKRADIHSDYLMYTPEGLFEMNHVEEGTGHVYKIKYNYPVT